MHPAPLRGSFGNAHYRHSGFTLHCSAALHFRPDARRHCEHGFSGDYFSGRCREQILRPDHLANIGRCGGISGRNRHMAGVGRAAAAGYEHHHRPCVGRQGFQRLGLNRGNAPVVSKSNLRMKKKLGPAITAFCALMLIAAWRLHGKVLAIVLIVLAALLAKTLIAAQQEKLARRRIPAIFRPRIAGHNHGLLMGGDASLELCVLHRLQDVAKPWTGAKTSAIRSSPVSRRGGRNTSSGVSLAFSSTN